MCVTSFFVHIPDFVEKSDADLMKWLVSGSFIRYNRQKMVETETGGRFSVSINSTKRG